MEQPEGFKVKGQEGKVLCLKCAIYGLKQATLAWWKALDKSMGELGFTCLCSDSGIFVNKCYRLDKWLNCLVVGVTPHGSAARITCVSYTSCASARGLVGGPWSNQSVLLGYLCLVSG